MKKLVKDKTSKERKSDLLNYAIQNDGMYLKDVESKDLDKVNDESKDKAKKDKKSKKVE